MEEFPVSPETFPDRPGRDASFSRTEMLLGRDGMERLHRARVAVFGLGGVGGYVAEALARSGIGTLDLIDSDTIAPSNLNRQILALRSTIGRLKADVAAERIRDISPCTVVHVWKVFYGPDTASLFDFSLYDYVADAIDTVTGKLLIAEEARRCQAGVISCMGTGNKLQPAALQVGDISETSVCPLARVMRRELKRRGIRHLKVVWSREAPIPPRTPSPQEPGRPSASGYAKPIPGSTAFVPAAAGFLMAGEIVRDLLYS